MQKVMLHLWFEHDAQPAVSTYISLFAGSALDRRSVVRDTPSGDAEVFEFHLAGVHFQAINGGPGFQHNGAISLSVECGDAQAIRRMHAVLMDGGREIRPLQAYPFGELYCWLQDRWGVHWQFLKTREPGTRIVPDLMFAGAMTGKAEEAMRFYVSLLPGSSIRDISAYGPGEAQVKEARHDYVLASLAGSMFSAVDSPLPREETFNEAASIVVHCKDQAEVDRLWAALSASPRHEACGWLKDRYGVSWQIVPEELYSLAIDARGEYDPGVTRAMLGMKKLDIAALRAAKTQSP